MADLTHGSSPWVLAVIFELLPPIFSDFCSLFRPSAHEGGHMAAFPSRSVSLYRLLTGPVQRHLQRLCGRCARQFVLSRLSIVDKLHLMLVEEEINRTSIIDRAFLMISEANCLIARKRLVRRLSIPDRK